MGKKRVVVVGGGGHAKVVIDMLLGSDEYEIVGFTSPSNINKEIFGVPYLGDDSILPELLRNGTRYFCVALGDNRLRKKLFIMLSELGFSPVNAVSSFATVSPFAKIGKGVVIMPGAVVNADVVIGDNTIINTRAGVDHDCEIGSHAHIAPGVSLAGNVVVGEGAFIGIGASIIPQVKIGQWATVGAGSVVISNIPSDSKVVGVPATKYI